jgi:hypothetical protein
MQNILLLHFREQRHLTNRQIEQKIGIPVARYRDYEQNGLAICKTDADLLAALSEIKADYLKAYSEQLEFFSASRSIVEMKDKRI